METKDVLRRGGAGHVPDRLPGDADTIVYLAKAVIVPKAVQNAKAVLVVPRLDLSFQGGEAYSHETVRERDSRERDV